MIGPMAAPAPEMPAQTAMALGRSWAGKTLVRIDSVEGITNAAARPMIARAPVTTAAESAVEARTVPNRKTVRPACRAPLRPNRSPMVPAVKRRPAKTRP